MRTELAFVLALSASGVIAATEAAQAGDPPSVLVQRLAGSRSLTVSSPAFRAGGAIPATYVDVSPPLSWTVAAGAKTYAVVVEDPDAPGSTPFVHWKLWNIAGGTTSLPKGLPTAARAPQLPGAVQGRNDAGGLGYYGPHPPPGRPHHYHFQVFALDAPLEVEPQSDVDELAAAMKGHVLGSGELVTTYQAR